MEILIFVLICTCIICIMFSFVNIVGHYTTSEVLCNCEIPCSRKKYETSLSYAQLSKLNIKQLVLHEDDRRLHVQKNFQAAAEELQRVKMEVVEYDVEFYEKITNKTENTADNLLNISRVFLDYHFFSEKYNVINLLETFENSNDFVIQLMDYCNANFWDDNLQFYDLMYFGFRTTLESLWEEFIPKDGKDNYINKMVECYYIFHRMPENCFERYYERLDGFPWTEVRDLLLQVDSVVLEIDKSLIFLEEVEQTNATLIARNSCQEEVNWYMSEGGNETITALRNNLTDLATVFKNEGKSSSSEQEDFFDIFEKIYEVSNTLNTNHVQTFIKHMEPTFYDDLQTDKYCEVDTMREPTLKACRCYGRDSFQTSYKVYTTTNKLLTISSDILRDIDDEFSATNKTIVQLSEFFNTNIADLVTIVRTYSKGDITKLEMANQYRNTLTLKTYQLFVDHISDLDSAIDQFINNIMNAQDFLSRALQSMFESDQPCFTVNTFNETSLGQLLLTHTTIPTYQQYLENFGDNFEENFRGLVDEHFLSTISSAENVIIPNIDSLRDIAHELGIYYGVLLEYLEEMKMDTSFYM